MPNALPLWLTALCIGRDVAIALGALIIIMPPGQTDVPPHARRQGQHDLPGLPDVFVLYLNAVGRSPEALGWLYVLTALLTAVSWVQYGFIGVRMLRRDRVPPGR